MLKLYIKNEDRDMATKKLIEVALPLERINAASAREKSIRHGHPSSLHLWWARRPLTAARAVIWASLVDDPSSHPNEFPTEELQNRERKRLFEILQDLIIWENSNDEEMLKKANDEILKSTKGKYPVFFDPFAGGGALPLEAQRLGLNVYASDLNPISVMINKALIDFPSRFCNLAPVNPESLGFSNQGWYRSQGLAEDLKYYGEWIRRNAFKEIGHLYPMVDIPEEQGGGKATVIAWLWARTVKCPNPTCGCIMPLASKFAISKKKNKEAWVEPVYDKGEFSFFIHKGKCPKDKETLKMGRGAIFKCPVCGEITLDEYVKEEGKAGRIGAQLMTIVAQGPKGRLYISPTVEQERVASIERPMDIIHGTMPNNPRWFSPPAFGMETYESLFTNRQLIALSTFSRLAREVKKIIEKDAIRAGMSNDHIGLKNDGDGAKAYSEAISVYLSFIVDQMANHSSALCGWHANNEQLMNTFGRQAIPMVWDFAEVNVFSSSTGSYKNLIDRQIEGFNNLGFKNGGKSDQNAAQTDIGLRDVLISTDPPYYDNIGYADLSDYFYVWLRNNMIEIYPDLFSTLLVPKEEELVATPYRFKNGMPEAKKFFENGMYEVCLNLYKYASDDYPLTIYYAYKQSDKVEKNNKATVSSGWETMLSSIIKAGFSITGTWPVRTEQTAALKSNVNALASSIVLVCRKRDKSAPQITRRNLITILRKELRPALKKLQETNIAPVDLAQSAIGPGMGVFSRYRCVLEADGTSMLVKDALQIINEEIDLYFNEQVGELDVMSRFCVDLYTQSAFNEIKFGDADVLARAKGTSVAAMVSYKIVYAKAGIVHLIEREELPESIDIQERCIWMLTQQLTRLMTTGGVEACANAVYMMYGSNAEKAKDLAYRLFTVAEKKKWTNEAYAYNTLVVSWPDIQSRAAAMQRETPEQLDLFSMGLIEG